MLRSVMYSDSITARAAEFVKLMESERGSLLTAQAPIGLVVVDVLRAIGLPENALSMVTGHNYDLFEESVDDTVPTENMAKCAFCEGFATSLVKSPRGEVYACARCAEHGEVVA